MIGRMKFILIHYISLIVWRNLEGILNGFGWNIDHTEFYVDIWLTMLDINAAINMRQYVKDNFPYILRLYRKYCRFKSIVYFRKIRYWPLQEVFEDAYKGMLHLKYASGGGSTLSATETIRTEITSLIEQFSIQTMVDAPCGDCNWMRLINKNMHKYYGLDIVKSLIIDNKIKYESEQQQFMVADITRDKCPRQI